MRNLFLKVFVATFVTTVVTALATRLAKSLADKALTASESTPKLQPVPVAANVPHRLRS